MKKKSRADYRKRARRQSGAEVTPQTNQIPLTPSSAGCDQVVGVSEEPGEFVPYDENLLERAHTQWQFGDWVSLAKLERTTLQHHPDRAKLALLAAAGHIQLGDTSVARQFTQLAQDWGCSKKLISQVLISGVHNTLGRAAVANGDGQRVLQHFEASFAIGMPGGDVRLLTQYHIGQQILKLGLTGGIEVRQPLGEGVAVVSCPVSVGQSIQSMVAKQLQNQSVELTAFIKKQNNDLISVGKSLENTIKKEMLNATKQIEAFLGIQSYFNTGELLPGMHGWPISPDFALYLIELLETNDYNLVIEFGSGTSTVIMAKTLAIIAHRRRGKSASSAGSVRTFRAIPPANLERTATS